MSRESHVVGWDGALVACATALTGLGVVMNYSTTAALEIGNALPSLALRHVAGVLGALAVAVCVARTPLRIWQRLALPLWAGGIVLLVLTPFIGIEANGARRWIALPGLPFSVQPSEFARLFTVMALAALLARATPRHVDSRAQLLRAGALVAVPVALLLFQPAFSSALMVIALAGLLLFAAGLPGRMLAWPAGLAGAGAALYVAVRPYALARVRGFLDPWRSADAEGFQVVQSFVAFGRGGTFGVGLGDGRQKLFYLPEAHTDFILSVVAEELGLIGVLAVIGAFAALCWAGLRVARRAREPFPLLLAVGCTGSVAIPALCNAAVVMGLIPTTGMALPFLSHGTNSLLCTAIAIGILLRSAREAEAAPAPALRAGGSRAPRGAGAPARRPERGGRSWALGRAAARPSQPQSARRAARAPQPRGSR